MPDKKPPIDSAVEDKIIEVVEAHNEKSPVLSPGEQVIRDKVIEEKIDEKISEAQIPPRDNMPSTTTAEEDLQSKGLRDTRRTQSLLAMFVVSTALIVSAAVVILAVIFRVMGITTVLDSLSLAAFNSLSNLASLVIGFYFANKLAGDKK